MNLRVLLATGAILLAVWLIVRFIRTVSYPLREKVVLITGGSRGLGLVLARHICARGGNVADHRHHEPGAHATGPSQPRT